MSTKRRKRHSPEQIVRKLRDADAMLNAGQDLAAVLQVLEVSESTLDRWRKQYGGMKSAEAIWLSTERCNILWLLSWLLLVTFCSEKSFQS